MTKIEFETLSQCPYCFSRNLIFLFKAPDRLTNLPGEFSLGKCNGCGLVFQNPRVQEKDIGFYYTNKLGYYNPPPARKAKNKSEINKCKDFFKKAALANHFDYKLKNGYPFWFFLTFPLKRFLKTKCYPFFREGGKLLEIGCSHGEFLEELKNLGWEAQGVEMDEKSAAFARNERNLEVYTKRIEDCYFEKGEFNAIIFRMVLEHLYQPFDVLKRITSWLKSDGQLIFSIPYFQGFEFQRFQNYAYGLHLPNHITFFTKKIIRNYLQKLGYKKIKFYHHFFERDITASACYKHQDTGRLFYKLLAYNKPIRFLLVKPFVFLLGVFGQSSRMTVYAVKA